MVNHPEEQVEETADSMDNEENNDENESSINSDTENTGVDTEFNENTGVDTEFNIPADLSRVTEANNKRIKEIEEEMDYLYGTRIRNDLRQRKQRSSIPRKFRDYEGDLHTLTSERMDLKEYATLYAKMHCTAGVPQHKNIMKSEIVTTILTQHHVSKGLRIFGEKGTNAVLTGLKQLHDKHVMEPLHGNQLTRKEKSAALQYLMFLKQKRSGKIKGRGCADGRKQRLYMDKDEVSSPTISTEALLLTCMIDAMKERDVSTVDIPGAFMQSDMEGEDTFMKIEGKMVDILKRIDPKMYEKYIITENGHEVLYVKLKKGIVRYTASLATVLEEPDSDVD